MFPKTTSEDDVPPEAAVCAHYVRCGKKNCRCARGQQHGPYYLWCWRDPETGRRRKRYVPQSEVAAARRRYELLRWKLGGAHTPRRREKSLLSLVIPNPGRGANLRAMHARRR